MATWTDINNGEGGGSVRSKLNTAMQYLFGWISDPPEGEDQSKWEAQGAIDIQPKDDKGIAGPNINIADDLIVPPSGDITISRNVTIGASGDLKLSKLATGGAPEPALIDIYGNLTTAEHLPALHTLTINVYAEGSGVPIDGHIVFYGLTGHDGMIPFSEVITINNLPDVSTSVQFQIFDEAANYQTYIGNITNILENTTINVFMLPWAGQEIGDVIEGRRGEWIDTGTASNLELSNPFAVVERDVNYTKTLPDAGDAKTVVMGARKAAAGGALTLVANGGFMMDGETGDVLTTTVKGAWIKVKSIDISGTDTWVVIQDSGDWTIDTI